MYDLRKLAYVIEEEEADDRSYPQYNSFGKIKTRY